MHLFAILLHLLVSEGLCIKYLQPNLALKRQAYQISTHSNSQRYQGPTKASRATDGNFAMRLDSNSCSRTNTASGPWWLVDLGQNYQVTQVAITTRDDDFCSVCEDRFNNFYIGVGTAFDDKNIAKFDPTSYNVCWYQNTSVPAGKTWVFTCAEEITGRFVTIYFPTTKRQSLSLCKVQVTNSPRMSGFFSESTASLVSRSLKLRCLTQCVRESSCTSVKLTPDGTCQLLTVEPNNDLTEGDFNLLHHY